MNASILVPRFWRIDREMDARSEFESLPRPQRQAMRLQRLNEAWGTAIEGSDYYARLAHEQDLPPRFQSLEEFSATVPMTPKSAVRDRPHDFLLRGRRRG